MKKYVKASSELQRAVTVGDLIDILKEYPLNSYMYSHFDVTLQGSAVVVSQRNGRIIVDTVPSY